MGESNQLTLKFRPGLRLSDRVFWKLCAANPELRLERTARGELVLMPLASSDTGRRNAALTGRLANWAEADRRGVGFDSSAGFTLPNGAIRSPDVSWIARHRWESLSREQQRGFAPLCPDFVAELRSKSDRKPTLRKKMREYIRQGARLGWLIDLVDDTAEIFRPDRPVEVLERPATLSGEDVLPGFVLDLKGILFD
jgi:Uma2 family endonuclease